MIEACAQLPVELDIVEGVPHDEARERYARADIVVDQLNAGWHGVFALEAMALGKPVVSHLKPDVVERSAEAFGIRVPIVPATKETLVEALRPLVESPALRREIGAASRAYVEQVHDIDRVADRLLDIYAQLVDARSSRLTGGGLARASASDKRISVGESNHGLRDREEGAPRGNMVSPGLVLARSSSDSARSRRSTGSAGSSRG